MSLSLDILQHIIDIFLYDDVRTVTRLIDCCRAHRMGLYIRNMQYIYIRPIVLHHRKFSKLEHLETWEPVNVHHVASTLRSLQVYESSTMMHEHIDGLRLARLAIGSAPFISDLSCIADTLRVLVCTTCPLTQAGISKLRLTELHLRGRYNNLDISCMADTLRVLNYMYVTQETIDKLRLTSLTIAHNRSVCDLNHMADTLRELDCTSCALKQTGISQLRLEVLRVRGCVGITSANHMADTLIELNCEGKCGIGQEGLACVSVRKLCMSHNHRIFDLNHMALTLRHLTARMCRGLTDAGVRQLKLAHLNAYGAPYVTDPNSTE